jgi:hypothetical protein
MEQCRLILKLWKDYALYTLCVKFLNTISEIIIFKEKKYDPQIL